MHNWRAGERRTDAPLIVAAFLYLGAYAWPILDPDLPHRQGRSRAINVAVLVALRPETPHPACPSEQRRRFLRRTGSMS
jgi:hypothetical protein